MAESPPPPPKFILERDPMETRSPINKLLDWGTSLVSGPVDWIHEKIVLPNRGPKYYWYHRKYDRAVPIDECYVDDYACMWEADIEYKRNKLVESELLKLLSDRYENCLKWERGKHGDDNIYQCEKELKDFKQADLNFFIKYGDLTYNGNVVTAFMKQKHRMIFERRKAAQEKAAKESENASTI